MSDLILFCKSYSGDLQRIKRLISGISQFNADSIPLYISVPEKEQPLFSKLLDECQYKAHLLTDQSIALCNPRVELEKYAHWDGRLSQQVIKSEFWRWYLRENPNANDITYVCIDSESQFIREFYRTDFLHASGSPFTVMHPNTDLLDLARQKNIDKVEQNFKKDCAQMKSVFSRVGQDFAFSPTPVIWSSKVWQDLDTLYLQPKGITLWDAIKERPNELHWYGEALLHFQSIPVYPIEPLFRVYHYDWEYYARVKLGETIGFLKTKFLGVLMQSSWDFEMDHGDHKQRKSLPSRLARRLKRYLSKYR